MSQAPLQTPDTPLCDAGGLVWKVCSGGHCPLRVASALPASFTVKHTSVSYSATFPSRKDAQKHHRNWFDTTWVLFSLFFWGFLFVCLFSVLGE